MAGHPPIGRPKPGDPTSAREQRGMAGASEELKAEMLELNLAYQERFGHVFLICATGLTGEQMRDAVRDRIGNSPEQEREIVRTELGKINRIRLDPPRRRRSRGAVSSDAPTTTASVSTHILDTSVGRPAAGVAVSLSARAAGASARVDGARRLRRPTRTGAARTCRRCRRAPPTYGSTSRPSRTSDEHTKQAEAQQDAPRVRDSGAFFPEVTITFAVDAGRALPRTAAAQPVRLLRIPRELSTTMPTILGQNQYGKAENRVVKITRDGATHHIKDLNVSVALSGDMDDVHYSGSNANVLPTDTTKNTVFAFAKEHGIESAEQFGIHLARHFVTSQEPIHRARIRIEEYAWERDSSTAGADEAQHSFVRKGQETRTAQITYDGERLGGPLRSQGPDGA